MAPPSRLKILCAFGKHQYGDPARGIGTEYAAFLPALRRLGHEVVHFESWNRACHPDFAALNRALLGAVIRERPDLLLTVQMHYEIWIETLEIIRGMGNVAAVSWTTDDSWKYPEVSRFIGRAYDAMTTTYPEVVPRYLRDGIPNVLLTQWAANSSFLAPPLPASRCRFPVSFVGAAHGSRPRWIRELGRRGIPVRCFGHGWPEGSVEAREIPEIMRQSVISLNFSNSRQGRQIKARTFEVPGAGGFLLTETAPGLERWYRINEEIEVFGTLPELAAKIAHILENPDRRDAMARRAFDRTRREHTYERRMADVVALALRAGMHRPRKAGGPGSPGPDARLARAAATHRMERPTAAVKQALVAACSALWGKRRGPRAARRLVFELSWRLAGRRTFTASGLPGRMFPEQ